MKCLLMVLGIWVASIGVAHSSPIYTLFLAANPMFTWTALATGNARILYPWGTIKKIYDGSSAVTMGRVLFAEVQDNGQSCVYTLSSRILFRTDSKVSMASIESHIEKQSGGISLVTSQSVAIDDVMDTLESRFDNSGKYSELFSVTPEVLSGEYGLYRGVILLGRGYRKSGGTVSLEQLIKAAQGTHSQGSVSCAKQPQI